MFFSYSANTEAVTICCFTKLGSKRTAIFCLEIRRLWWRLANKELQEPGIDNKSSQEYLETCGMSGQPLLNTKDECLSNTQVYVALIPLWNAYIENNQPDMKKLQCIFGIFASNLKQILLQGQCPSEACSEPCYDCRHEEEDCSGVRWSTFTFPFYRTRS